MVYRSLAVLSVALVFLSGVAVLAGGIETPPPGYWGDYPNLIRGWLEEFNKFRSEEGLPTFVWSDRLYVVLVEYALEIKSHDLDLNEIPGPCEKPTQRARRNHRWNLRMYDNHTVFPKASYSPEEAVKSVKSVSIIKSVRDPRMNAAAVAILERNEEEVYIIMATARIDVEPVMKARECLELNVAILKNPQATSEDRVKAIRDIAAQKNFEVAFTLLEYARDPDPAVAKEAVKGLGRLTDPSFTLPLIKALGASGPEVDEEIFTVLMRITGRSDLGKDADAWRTWFDRQGITVIKPFEVPEETVDLSDEEIKDLLREFEWELDDGGPERRIEAIRKIARIRHPKVAKALCLALNDKVPEVRKVGAEALAVQADKGTLKALCRAYTYNRGREDIQAAVVRALGAIGDYRAIPTLKKDLIRPGIPEVTRARLEAFGNIRHRESIQALIDFMWRWGRGAKSFAKPLGESLRKLTGQDFGRDRNAWKNWWDRNKRIFRFPPEEKD